MTFFVGDFVNILNLDKIAVIDKFNSSDQSYELSLLGGKKCGTFLITDLKLNNRGWLGRFVDLYNIYSSKHQVKPNMLVLDKASWSYLNKEVLEIPDFMNGMTVQIVSRAGESVVGFYKRLALRRMVF